MGKPTKLQALVTGELAGTWCVLINAHVHPQHPRKQGLLPQGYSKDVRWSDGSVTDGVLKPVPIYIDDLVRAYQRVREEARIVLPGHDWRLWDLHPGGRVI